MLCSLAESGIPGKQYFGQAFHHPSENVPFGTQAACGMGHGSRPDVLRGWSRWPELLLSDGGGGDLQAGSADKDFHRQPDASKDAVV